MAKSATDSGVERALPQLFSRPGGWLGVFFMIPLRRQLIVAEHGNLLYPEGTACADVLVAVEIVLAAPAVELEVMRLMRAVDDAGGVAQQAAPL